MRRRAPISRPAGSRRWLDSELAALRRTPRSPRAWLLFIGRSGGRSLEQWRLHPRASRQLIAAHLLLLALTRSAWTAASFAYCATHLGLLGEDDRLTPADLVTLVRANLPALLPASRWTPALAALSDVLDGALARRTGPGTGTAFGAYLDLLADVTFWSWHAIRREPAPAIRLLGLGFWALPAAALTAAYFVSGRSIDYPRLRLVRRISGAVQGLLALRGVVVDARR